MNTRAFATAATTALIVSVSAASPASAVTVDSVPAFNMTVPTSYLFATASGGRLLVEFPDRAAGNPLAELKFPDLPPVTLPATPGVRLLCVSANECYLKNSGLTRDLEWHRLAAGSLTITELPSLPDTHGLGLDGYGRMKVAVSQRVKGLGVRRGEWAAAATSSNAAATSINLPGVVIPTTVPGPVGKPLPKAVKVTVSAGFTPEAGAEPGPLSQ